MTELKELQVDEVSLVDDGANPQANILFFKRKQEEKSMAKDVKTAEVVEKQEVQVTEPVVKVEEPTVDTEKETLQKRVAELEKVLAEREAADKAAIEKAAQDKLAADNAAVTALIERLEKRMEDHIEKAETAELLKVASKYEILGENAEELSKVLKSVKGTDVYNKIISNLDRELAYVEKSGTFSEIGKVGANTQASSIEKFTAEIQKSNPKLTYHQAKDLAYQAHPELQD